ncbi:MAG: prepilin-type N-terminal cleavage/methylation domain-containing protein [Verrucomicrobiota bacterium]
MKRNGFTLVEIAVVVALVGLLVALGSMAIMKGVNNSRIKNSQAELEVLSAAVLQLAWDTGRWPNGEPRNIVSSAEMWDISPDACGLMGNDGSFGNNWKGPYYDGSIQDQWGNPYFFDPDYSTTNGTRVVVGSFGPNGKGPNLYDSDDVYVLLDD